MGFTEEGGRCGNVTTCLDHLKELGVTHVQLMPVADYATVNEKSPTLGSITGATTLKTICAWRATTPPTPRTAACA